MQAKRSHQGHTAACKYERKAFFIYIFFLHSQLLTPWSIYSVIVTGNSHSVSPSPEYGRTTQQGDQEMVIQIQSMFVGSIFYSQPPLSRSGAQSHLDKVITAEWLGGGDTDEC